MSLAALFPAACVFSLFMSAAFAQDSVRFMAPADGVTVAQTFTVEMGVTGMTVGPAGELKVSSGQHHVIVDGSPIATGEVVPVDENPIHFGNGQIETTLTLAPGTQTLTLQFAEGLDRSYGTGMSSTITVQIE